VERTDRKAGLRGQLHDYGAIGAEMRLAGSRSTETPPVPAWLGSPAPRGRLLPPRALTARILIPRYAAGLVAGVILALASIPMLLARRWKFPSKVEAHCF